MADASRAPGQSKPKPKPTTKPKVEKRRQPPRSYGLLSIFFEKPADRVQRYRELVLRATVEELRKQGEDASADRLLEAQAADSESDDSHSDH